MIQNLVPLTEKKCGGDPQIHVKNNIYVKLAFTDMGILQSYKDDLIIYLIDLVSYDFWKKEWK